jgi:hypothetical protein
MQAGNVMDELIKTKVIGWVSEPSELKGSLEIPGMVNYYEYENGTRYEVNSLARFYCPSTDIADSWGMLETLKNRLNAICISLAWYNGEYRCYIRIAENDFAAVADTPSLAICRAALKAV